MTVPNTKTLNDEKEAKIGKNLIVVKTYKYTLRITKYSPSSLACTSAPCCSKYSTTSFLPNPI